MPSRRLYGPYRRGLRWRVHIREDGRTSYASFGSKKAANDFVAKDIAVLGETSDRILAHAIAVGSNKRGWVYAVATVPDLDIQRVKVGFTTAISERFLGLRTANPTAVLIALWPADEDDEIRAHEVLSGRIGVSECFTVPSLLKAMQKIDEALGPRLIAPASGDPPRRRVVRQRFAAARQPDPEPNGSTPIADLVIADVRARQLLGQRRHGADLQANNGRDAVVDAYQQAIDLTMYLRQVLEEREGKSIDPMERVRAQQGT